MMSSSPAPTLGARRIREKQTMAFTMDTVFIGWVMMALGAGIALTICLSVICSLCDFCSGRHSKKASAEQNLLLRAASIEETQEIPLEAFVIRAA
jgi:hypothetical protein